PMPVGEAVDAILQVIDGLEAAEAGGVLHRDVKPANCFVDREGTVKVGDFGLSISVSLRDESNLTTDGTFLGTPAFSSPEQLRGDELDVRSDIYAVGVTLYYLLTGQMPFKADNMIRLIATVLESSPASPAELRADIPKGLAQAVLRCLQKQPAARFRDYDELRRALAPFGSAAPTPAAFRLRLAAGIIDHSLWGFAGMLFNLAWFRDAEPMSRQDFLNSPDYGLILAIQCLTYVASFGVLEGIWGASLGKMICGLRIADPKRDAVGVPKALFRAGVYVMFPQCVNLAYAGLIAAGATSGLPAPWAPVLQYSWCVLMLLMFSTVRRRNGYAGFQDLLSNTRVVSKSSLQTRPVLTVEEEPLPETAATPQIGAYYVLNSLDKTPPEELLLGYDSRLLRKVWIRTLPEDEPAVTADVRELGRPGRLRWLAGRRLPGECWDVYEAPSGSPLVNLLDQRQPWESVRYWLVDLAEELSTGLKRESPPAVLALDRIWITSEGRAKLLDFPAPGVDRGSRWCNLSQLAGADPAATRPFLNQVAVAALEGRAIEPEEACHRPVAVPLPLHARDVLNRLSTAEDPEMLPRRLKPLLGSTPSVTRLRRMGLLAASLLPLVLMFAVLIVLGVLMERWWLDEHPEAAPLRYCLRRLDTLGAASDPATDVQAADARAEERRALEVYVAGRFGKTISDPDTWSGPYDAWSGPSTEWFFSEQQRRIAQKVLARYPNPSEEDITEATARLQAFLEEMPQRPSYIRAEDVPLVGMILLIALCAGLLFWVAIPSALFALLFRGGPLMYVLGIAAVRGDGSRASRLRMFCRALI
ncbi:MAG: protein kinase domain-containing protein, partial [Planctomycetota bacterium]